MIDAIKAIRDYLLTDAALVALVGMRIYGNRDTPPQGYDPGDGAGVTFHIRGGRADYDDALLSPSVQFKVYGATELSADTAYRALYDALQNATGASVLHAECETLGQALEEPETGWYFILTYFTILLRQ